MTATCACLGLCSGLVSSSLRFAGLALRDGQPLKSPFVLGLGLMGGLAAGLQMTTLQIVLKLYK